MRELRRRVVRLAFILLVVLGAPISPVGTAFEFQPASPTSGPEVLAATSVAKLNFPTGIEIESTIALPSDSARSSLELLYRTTGNDTITLAGTFSPDPNPDGAWSVTTTLDLQAHYLPVGVDVAWWWRLGDGRDIVAESVPEVTSWHDDRWEWRAIETEQVTLHTYALDPEFAAQVLETVQSTVTELETRFGIDRTLPLSVWIYDSNDDFQIAKPPNSRESIAALSYPALNLIAAILSDGDERELLRVLPHEVSHHVLAQATENPFTVTPLWFDEGMATHVQTGGVDGYADMVSRAGKHGQLYDLNSLTAAFPFQPMQATLAYATSWSAIDYLAETYGDQGIARMIDAFGKGIPYDAAIEASLGIDSGQLNDDWTSWVANR